LGLGLATEEVSAGPQPQVAGHRASKLILDWSPEQIFGWLETQYPMTRACACPNETIYRSLFIQGPWSAEKRAAGPAAVEAAHAPFAPCQC